MPTDGVARAREAALHNIRDASEVDPKRLINEIRYFDPVTGQYVDFRMFPKSPWHLPPLEFLGDGNWKFRNQGAEDWYWQAQIIDWLHDPTLHAYIILKARQLGITLLSCAYALWLMLYRPGSTCAAFSYTEEEAYKLTEAVWAMFESLPEPLRNGVRVITPSRGDVPKEWIRLRHPDGRLSSFQALPATKRHGHGARVTFGIMDEVARQDYAREIWEAILPATLSRGGKLIGISTAWGVSNAETGEGNFFHHLWYTRNEKKLAWKFLPWNLEPTRDEDWYERVAMKLDEVERNRQYPRNANDAFMLSGAIYFERESLTWYGENAIEPMYRGEFVVTGRKAQFRKLKDGITEVYAAPVPEREYAISCDAATGKGTDYTSADVIDLTTGQIVAHMHARIEAPRAARQLYFMGRWYNNAKIAPERQGGYGDAIIIALKEGTRDLPPYPNLYRHKSFTKGRRKMSEDYGMPMGAETRNHVLEQLKKRLRDHFYPYLPSGTVDELNTFVYSDTIPSPRAQEGLNDDRVLSLAIATELFRQYGTDPGKQARQEERKHHHKGYQPSPARSGR